MTINRFLTKNNLAAAALIILSLSSLYPPESHGAALSLPSDVSRSISLPQDSTGADVQGIVVVLRPTGFEPEDLQVVEGRYLVLVQNRSGIRNLTFHLDTDKGQRLQEVHDQRLQWKKQVDLTPGTYVLSVVEQPSWHFSLKVNAR